MILAGQQPNYLPWIGLFAKAALCDVFAVVDHVQYVKKSVVNRNRILSPAGEPILLSVPVRTGGRRFQRIDEVEIDDRSPWRRKHSRSLSLCYGRAPFWREHAPFFEDLYGRRWERLADLNFEVLRYLFGAFRIPAPLRRTGSLGIEGAKTAMLISLCRAFGCDTYLSGAGARKYVEEARFAEAGLAHRFQRFVHPVYRQGDGRRSFVPNLSALDLLLNEGPAAAEILRAAGPEGRGG